MQKMIDYAKQTTREIPWQWLHQKCSRKIPSISYPVLVKGVNLRIQPAGSIFHMFPKRQVLEHTRTFHGLAISELLEVKREFDSIG